MPFRIHEQINSVLLSRPRLPSTLCCITIIIGIKKAHNNTLLSSALKPQLTFRRHISSPMPLRSWHHFALTLPPAGSSPDLPSHFNHIARLYKSALLDLSPPMPTPAPNQRLKLHPCLSTQSAPADIAIHTSWLRTESPPWHTYSSHDFPSHFHHFHHHPFLEIRGLVRRGVPLSSGCLFRTGRT